MSQKRGAIILVIDDEVQIRRLLKISLENNGFQYCEAFSGKEGLIQAAYKKPDLIILDLNLPDENGLDILKKIREWSQVPVIVLSVIHNEEDKIALLDAGADDYLTKPFNTGELLARIRVALRRSLSLVSQEVFQSGPLEIDFIARTVKVNQEPVHLTPTEYSIMILLAKYAGKVLTHNQIIKEIWGKQEGVETSYIRVYINQMRKKIERNSKSPLIQTEPGVGYRLILY